MVEVALGCPVVHVEAVRVLQAVSLQEWSGLHAVRPIVVEWSSFGKTNRGGEMEDEMEEMWKKLSFTEEEGESISLGSSTTEAAKLVGKNCIVMKVLSHRCMNIEALRKNLRMLWKPNKGVQINEIGEELFLVEFGDGRDKKRVMDMSPWTYEKQLILLKEFVGEQVPKEISLWQSPFWVQIHNLPLNSRTREMGWAIGSKLGEIMDVDVADSGSNGGNISE
nr:hypothetical protein CFP56_55440 [Quercus suber]